MKRPNHLIDHFNNPRFQGTRDSILFAPVSARLGLVYRVVPGDWQTVAKYISGPAQWPVTWCPDANVAFLPTTDVIWDALRVAALGSTNGSTLITNVIAAQMKEWLDDPWLFAKRASDIRSALINETWIKHYNLNHTSVIGRTAFGYAHLLGSRRGVTLAHPDGSTLVGTPAADKVETMNAVMKTLGPRAMGLAKKGRRDFEKRGKIYIDDELHCLMVISYALVNHTDAVLLTADSDFLEIFYKAQWFIDTHYRAWLAASLVKDGRYGEPAKEFTDTGPYFEGALTLYRRLTDQLREVLPPAKRPVRVGVVYVAPDGFIHKMVFPFEPQMLDMLETRGKTDGRCTDLFGDANIHVDLGPLKPKMDGLYLGIGRDVTKTFKTNGIPCQLAGLDLAHSWHCFEEHVFKHRAI